MNSSQLRIAAHPPLAAVNALLATANLPASDLTDEHCRHFFCVGPAHAPLGVVGLELLGAVALLRSLAVASGSQNSGAGSALVQRAETYARQCGVQHLYLLTTTAEAFFARRGYQHVARDAAPPEIRATREFAGICPASSALMTKQL
jgi:amino-acid N-acetyltransferase